MSKTTGRMKGVQGIRKEKNAEENEGKKLRGEKAI